MAVVAAIAAFKVTVGHDIPVADFLLIPVAITGWLVKARAYAYIAAFCTAGVSVVIATTGQARLRWPRRSRPQACASRCT